MKTQSPIIIPADLHPTTEEQAVLITAYLFHVGSSSLKQDISKRGITVLMQVLLEQHSVHYLLKGITAKMNLAKLAIVSRYPGFDETVEAIERYLSTEETSI